MIYMLQLKVPAICIYAHFHHCLDSHPVWFDPSLHNYWTQHNHWLSLLSENKSHIYSCQESMGDKAALFNIYEYTPLVHIYTILFKQFLTIEGHFLLQLLFEVNLSELWFRSFLGNTVYNANMTLWVKEVIQYIMSTWCFG